MIKKGILLMSVLLLSACVTKTVEVPVYSCPAPQVINYPKLEISTITEKSTTAQILRAYGKDIPTLISYSRALRDQLKVYDRLSKENQNPLIDKSK